MSEYARYFKQQLLSDCNLVISWPKSDSPHEEGGCMNCCPKEGRPGSAESRAGGSDQDQVAQIYYESSNFPAHLLVLFKSSHFKAQGQRWQHALLSMRPAAKTQHHAESSEAVAGDPTEEKAEIVLSIDAEEQLPAAEAVIAAMYGVERCFADLPHDRLVHALVIADMIDLPGVANQISKALETAAISGAGLSTAGLETMANLPAWTNCMYELLQSIIVNFTFEKQIPTTGSVAKLETVLAADNNGLIQRILLAAFGDLQAVWQNPVSSQLLMKLPLPAIQLLLSSDNLQVPSEDFVLYTVEQYSRSWGLTDSLSPNSTPDFVAALSSLVRAPYLSDLALQSIMLSSSYVGHVLMYKSQGADLMWQLTMLRRVLGSLPPASELKILRGVTQSWLQGHRSLVTEKPASVVWKLSIEQLAELCKRAAKNRSTQFIWGPESPPIGGLSWKMRIDCHGQKDGTTVGLDVQCCKAISKLYHRVQYRITHNLLLNQQRVWDSRCSLQLLGSSDSWVDFFRVGPMASGWDADAWFSKGLPTSGDLVLELKLLKVW